MKRSVSLFLAMIMTLLCLPGCNKAPSVDKSVRPEQIFSCYKTLTDQYGVSISKTLENINIDPQTVINDGSAVFGIPWEEEYAGISFDVGLYFGTGEQFSGVRYKSMYTYPEDEYQLLQDAVAVCKQLISDFGDKLDATFAFNWVEVYLNEEWDRDIRYWEDTSVLKRLLDEGYSGPLLAWDITPVCGDHVKSYLQELYGKDGRRSLMISINVDEDQGLAYLEIMY